nr:DUF3313 domain-containing protein [Ruegeria arenilitoris]
MTGCDAIRQTGDLDPSGFLTPDIYAKLEEPGDPLRAGLSYINPDFDASGYDKLLFDPIVSFTDQAGRGNLNAQDSQALSNYFYSLIANELSQDLKLVTSPGPNTLRFKLAIIKATKKNVTMDTISTVVPVAHVATRAAGYVTDKPVFNGQLKIEFEMRDSLSRELLGAGIDSRVGGKVLTQDQFDAWSDVNKAMEIYAQGMRYRLCLLRKMPDCKPPTVR